MTGRLFNSTRPQIPNLERLAITALDLGCGNRIIFDDAALSRSGFGADVYPERNRTPVVACKGEALPFKDYTFDLVTARVALPYMHIPSALREIRRVMLPNGTFWGTLHLPRMAWKRIRFSLWRLDLVDAGFQFCAIVNCWLLCVCDWQIGRGGRYESVQTPRSMRNALLRAGFACVETEIVTDERGQHFAVQVRVLK